MNPDDARRLVGDLVEPIVEHVVEPPHGPTEVVRFASPADLVRAFAPAGGLELAADALPLPPEMIGDAVERVLEYSVRTSHPRFLNQNFAGPDPVAVLGDWLGAALNTTAATYEVAPVFTLMERAVLSRLAVIAGYDAGPGTGVGGQPAGIMCAGGSLATLHALQLARHRARPDVLRTGDTERWAVFVSSAGHYSTRKSAALLGLGTDAVVEVPVDARGAMRVDDLQDAVARSADEGRRPLAVVATAGTTVTGAFDPLDPIAEVCEANGLWLHVDGCYGGSALFSPTQRHRLDGVERSDSMVWNLHKMMGMTQQCTALLVRRPAALAAAFATGADYLFQPDKEHAALDAGDLAFACGRRVDALKLWLAWKVHGDRGFAARVDRAVALADHARRRISASEGAVAAVVPGDFTNVCLTWVPPELRPLDRSRLAEPDRKRLHGLAPAVKARMQREGTAMIGYQPVDGLNAFRLIVMNPEVTEDDIDAVLDLIVRYSEEAWSSATATG